ncbi:response regulator [Trinickia symbiotica]|uniref:hybrid sensor histidine kinase/response regulator n=1 Tax=Trinickia symbiotica TaxID=863227 RepID=UPI003F79EFE3
MMDTVQQLRTLLVEDNPTDALVIGEVLADVPDFQHRLVHAQSLSEALARVRAVPFDVVLLDLGLPDAQGLDTFKAFHRQAPELPVLVLTGLDDSSVGLQAIHHGAQDYLQKRDIRPSELSRAIRYAIERHREAVALKESRGELQRLSANIQHVREEEKARVARELHDDLGQQLAALKIEVGKIENRAEGARTAMSGADLGNIHDLLDRLIVSVRRIAADLRPAILDELGLLPAIEWFTDEFSARHRVRVIRRIAADDIEFNRRSATAIFRIVQESMMNVVRHAGATEVTLEIECKGGNCVVTISDNGHGCPGDERPSSNSFGLLGMRERAAGLNGELSIRTSPGHGFRLSVSLPLAAIVGPE